MRSPADVDTLKGLRDRALLLFGFASVIRRSELVSLTIEDLEEAKRGLLVTLRRAETDQEGGGRNPLSLQPSAMR
jgi:site-specific recombinase XerD